MRWARAERASRARERSARAAPAPLPPHLRQSLQPLRRGVGGGRGAVDRRQQLGAVVRERKAEMSRKVRIGRTMNESYSLEGKI